MTAHIRLVIEAYEGSVRNVYVLQEPPDVHIEAVVVDWDEEPPARKDEVAVRAVDIDGGPVFANVWHARIKAWRLLPVAGLQEILDRAGLAEFGAPDSPAATSRNGRHEDCGSGSRLDAAN